MTLTLNKLQQKAYERITRFLHSSDKNFLLLGPAGSGKTTVIVNAFNNTDYKIAFCAFTNKATQVLCKIADKFTINFKADFMTIHSLLNLELNYLDYDNVSFKLNLDKVEGLKDYNIIIFDECSTISADLFNFINQAADHIQAKHQVKLKFIFLGDFWQLPPVGEDKSVVFQIAVKDKWPVSKLSKVMRSANDQIDYINSTMLEWIPKFKEHDDELETFVRRYPYNLIPRKYTSYLNSDVFYKKFMKIWAEETSDCVILTYSLANCQKTNLAIQDLIDKQAKRRNPVRSILKFYAGDRCCLDRPIDLYKINIKQQKKTHDYSIVKVDEKQSGELLNELESDLLTDEQESIAMLSMPLGITLYNGEIFDIIDTEDLKIRTSLNSMKGVKKYFNGQLLTIAKPLDPIVRYQVLHIYQEQVEQARQTIKSNSSRLTYLNVMSDFAKLYPKLNYGYCITIYKSQGSEWNTVFINLNSIKWSLVGDNTQTTEKNKVSLFKCTYTAASRASNKLYCSWF